MMNNLPVFFAVFMCIPPFLKTGRPRRLLEVAAFRYANTSLLSRFQATDTGNRYNTLNCSIGPPENLLEKLEDFVT